jgi:hypothetical protein
MCGGGFQAPDSEGEVCARRGKDVPACVSELGVAKWRVGMSEFFDRLAV